MTDFKNLSERLSPIIQSILVDICPGGAMAGNEYKASGVTGGPGKSFSFNVNTGKWADFATGEKGGDIISLYATARGVKQGVAAKELEERYLGKTKKPMHSYPEVTPNDKPKIIKPPPNANPPGFHHKKWGEPTQVWTYKDTDGSVLFYVARYDTNSGKEFAPWTFNSSGRWEAKGWPQPRPLYNLDKIAKNPDKPILIVEGEKSADAAEKLTSAYVVTTWPFGASSVNTADFTPIYGKNVLLWPDGDDAGTKYMGLLAAKLVDHCNVVKYIEPNYNSGWDAADALATPGFNFQAWARPLVQTIAKHVRAEVMPEPDEPADESRVPTNLNLMYKHLNLDTTHEGQRVVMNTTNVVRLLNGLPEFKGKIWYDTFHQKIFTTVWSDEPMSLNDNAELLVMNDIVTKYKFIKIAKSHVFDAINTVAALNQRNPVQEWIKSLAWDGVARVQGFLRAAMGAADDEYTRAVSQNFLISMAARVLDPGCKVDTMVILEGMQGKKKTSALEELVGKEYCAAACPNLDSKDFEQGLVGRMIVEFAELDQFRKAETTLIKSKLSIRIDSYRQSYGRRVIDVPRTCVFVGTTNKDKYLQDETGARRFWPIKIVECDLDYIRANREQLFAEAVSLFKSGATWWEVPEQAAHEQEARREEHPWQQIISEWLDQNPYAAHVTSKDLLMDVIGEEARNFTQQKYKELAKVMTILGYENKVTTDKDRKRLRVWKKKGAAHAEAQQRLDEVRAKRPHNYAPGADNSEVH